MYHVLLPLDDSEERTRAQVAATVALPHAEESVTATVLHVFRDEETAEKTAVEQTSAGKVAMKELREAGVTANARSGHGDPERQIIAVAEELDVDMIVLGGRKRSPLGALVFGSVSQAVILDSERPVAVTGRGASAE
ncbi:universal stress protein [Halomicroarcula limicola]|uniref:Universal stress protein n=1 Tax=Haloarcula limicola TaxID=1429915 RepID=A0A8J8C6Z3_9EURY|nr:universal stress protein [Halomicroarcula limicola]MBV0924508.1 universal stress protein [Halomicroarcula limicola]